MPNFWTCRKKTVLVHKNALIVQAATLMIIVKILLKCANCGEPHSSAFKGCKAFQKAIDIKKLAKQET